MNDEPDPIWKSSALFGGPLTLGAQGKLPLLPRDKQCLQYNNTLA